MSNRQKTICFVFSTLIGMAIGKAITDAIDRKDKESKEFESQMKVMDDAIAEMNEKLKANREVLLSNK